MFERLDPIQLVKRQQIPTAHNKVFEHWIIAEEMVQIYTETVTILNRLYYSTVISNQAQGIEEILNDDTVAQVKNCAINMTV